MKKISIVILALLMIQPVLAVITVTPTAQTINVQAGSSVQRIFTLISDQQESVPISKGGGSIANWIDFDNYYPNVTNTSNTYVTMTMTIPSSAQTSTYTISHGFGSATSTTTLNVQGQQQTINPTQCTLDVFPLTLTNIKVKQGETKTRNVQITVPSCYPSHVKIQGVTLQTDEKPLQLGELSLGILQPGNSVLIPIEIDAVDASTGQYSDTLSLLIYNSTGSRIDVPAISISTLVTIGISPISNFSLSDLPSCSLSSIQLTTNSTYKLTCSNPNPNIDIRPVVDKKMIVGVNVVPGTQYVYEFKPVLIGTTIIGAEFWYKNAPIGSGFEQEVRITPSGNEPISGTQIRFEFFPSLINANEGENLVVHAVDNKTGSYIQSAKIYLDGLEINNSLSLKSGKNYTLRAEANGYLGYVETIAINSRIIELTLNPLSGFMEGKLIKITTKPENVSLFLDGAKLTSTDFFPIKGFHVLEAIEEGYKGYSTNFTVEEGLAILSNIPELKKGIQQVLNINKNASWQVLFADDLTSQFNPIASGISDKIIFTPEKAGLYKISLNNEDKWSSEIKGWGGKVLGMQWYVWIIAIAILGTSVFFIFRRNHHGIENVTPYS